MHRRTFIATAIAAGLSSQAALAKAATPRMTVWKSPTCGCCGAWVEHVRAAGFAVGIRDVPQELLDAKKDEMGVSPQVASCHTAVIDGYVIEGHVPAADIRRLLAERPDVLGLAVPAMPLGSPGMELGDAKDPFVTLLLAHDGAGTVFARHNGA